MKQKKSALAACSFFIEKSFIPIENFYLIPGGK